MRKYKCLTNTKNFKEMGIFSFKPFYVAHTGKHESDV